MLSFFGLRDESLRAAGRILLSCETQADLFLLLCLVLAAVSCKDSGEERNHVLKVYNWADYIDEDVLAEFPAWYKQQTGEDIRLIYQVFDINEIMLTKIERGHEDFDVVCPSEYIIERMLKKDLLLPIDRNFGKTPDYLPNISPYIRRELNKTSQPGRGKGEGICLLIFSFFIQQVYLDYAFVFRLTG